MPSKVIIVMLRQNSGENERSDQRRPDPFYEFGSYGCTGCHGKSLLHKRNREALQGVKLAFAQGGSASVKLVYLSPPVMVDYCGEKLEAAWSPKSYRDRLLSPTSDQDSLACWEPMDRPFRYGPAPTLASNLGAAHFPNLAALYSRANRTTPVGQFSSCFRARAQPLEPEIAKEIIDVYERMKNAAREEDFAENYWETMETPPPIKDTNRRATYKERCGQSGHCGETGNGGAPTTRGRKGGC